MKKKSKYLKRATTSKLVNQTLSNAFEQMEKLGSSKSQEKLENIKSIAVTEFTEALDEMQSFVINSQKKNRMSFKKTMSKELKVMKGGEKCTL